MKINHASGFSIQFPRYWKVVEDPSRQINIVALGPPDSAGFSANVTVAVGPMEPQTPDMHAFHDETWHEIAGQLDEAQLIDLVVENDAFRRLISHVHQGRALTLEQWVWLWKTPTGLQGVTVSATVPNLHYPDYLDQFVAIVESWQPQGKGQE